MGAIQNIAVAGIAETVMIIGMGAVGMGALMVCFSLFPFQHLKMITLFHGVDHFLYV